MKTKNLIILFACICMMFSTNSFGQFEQKYTLQTSLGMVKPLGDIGDYFNSGLSLDAGVQYNYSRSLAFVGLFKFVNFFVKEADINAKFNSIGINICPKYRFFPESKYNPYVFGGCGLFFSKFIEDSDEYKFPASFGYTFGAGADLALTEKLALFLQGGFNSFVVNDEGYKDKINCLYFQVGLNISFLKSKSL